MFVSIFRPPKTRDSEWSEAIGTLKSEIEFVQSHRNFQRIILGGDLNFKNLEWLPNSLCFREEILIRFQYNSIMYTNMNACS